MGYLSYQLVSRISSINSIITIIVTIIYQIIFSKSMNIFKPAAWCSFNSLSIACTSVHICYPAARSKQCSEFYKNILNCSPVGFWPGRFGQWTHPPGGWTAEHWTTREKNVAGRHWLELELQWSYHWSWWLVQSSWCHHLGRSCENDFTWRFSMDENRHVFESWISKLQQKERINHE